MIEAKLCKEYCQDCEMASPCSVLEYFCPPIKKLQSLLEENKVEKSEILPGEVDEDVN